MEGLASEDSPSAGVSLASSADLDSEVSAASWVPEELADVQLPADFDAELERLLRGDGSGHAPQEDGQGGLIGTDDDADDTPDDSGDGDSPHDGPTGDQGR